jgi:hypothetical protein
MRRPTAAVATTSDNGRKPSACLGIGEINRASEARWDAVPYLGAQVPRPPQRAEDA